MAGPLDPFTPGPGVDPIASLPDQDTFESLRKQWATFMDSPAGSTGLLQAGLSLMGGRQWGDTPASQVARAIGSAGEAVTRRGIEESKTALDAAKVEALEARADRARMAASTGEDRMAIARLQEEGRMARANAKREQEALVEYRRQRDSEIKRYNELRPAEKKKEGPLKLMDYPEWRAYQGLPPIPGLQDRVRGAIKKPTAKPAEDDSED